MGVISVRIPEDLQDELERAGIKISETVRDDLTERAMRLRLARKNETLAKYRRPASRPVADIVRDLRDEH